MSITNNYLEAVRPPDVKSNPLGLIEVRRVFRWKGGDLKNTKDPRIVEEFCFDPYGTPDGWYDPSNPKKYHPPMKDVNDGRDLQTFPDCYLASQRYSPASDREAIITKIYVRAENTVRLTDTPEISRDEYDRRVLRARYIILHDAPVGNKEGDIGIDTWPGDSTLVLARETRDEGEAVDFITRTFVEATVDLQQIGEAEVDIQDDGISYRVTYIQLASATYVPGVVGTTTFEGHPMTRELKRGNASVRTVVRFFEAGGVKVSRRSQSINGSGCSTYDLIRVRIPKGESFTPPSGWVLIDQDTQEDDELNVIATVNTYMTKPSDSTFPQSVKYPFPGYRNIVAAGNIIISEAFEPRTRYVSQEVTVEYFLQSDPPSPLSIEFELIQDLTTEVIPASGNGMGQVRVYRNIIGGININANYGLGYSEEGQSDPNLYPDGLKRIMSVVDLYKCGLDTQKIWVRRSIKIPFSFPF